MLKIPVYVRADTKQHAFNRMISDLGEAGYIIVDYRVYALGYMVTEDHISQMHHGVAIMLNSDRGGWYRIDATIQNAN